MDSSRMNRRRQARSQRREEERAVKRRRSHDLAPERIRSAARGCVGALWGALLYLDPPYHPYNPKGRTV